MIVRNLTKHDTSVIKGIAILCIVLHNYFHYVTPFTGENEFDFKPERITTFIDLIANNPFDIINKIFSYLGHYGVEAFILISGYGLAKSMQKNRPDWLQFIVGRMKKLYPLIITGIILYIATIFVVNHQLISETNCYSIIRKLFFIHTLIPGDGLSTIGPWWFFGLIFQLYLIFPLIFKLIEKHGTKAFLIIASASLLVIYCETFGVISNEYITVMQNAPGHLAEFALGIWIAQNCGKKIPNIIVFLAMMAIVLGNCHIAFFPLTFISVAFITAWISTAIHISTHKFKLLAFIGSLSMIMFVTNGYIRDAFIYNIELNNCAKTYIFSLIFLITLTVVSFIGKYIYNALQNAFNWGINVIKRISAITKHKTSISNTAKIIIALILCYFTITYSTLETNAISTEEPEINNKELKINSESEFISIIKETRINRNYVKLSITIDFDVYDCSGTPPIVVFDIKNTLWEKSDIASNMNNGHCKIRKTLIIPTTLNSKMLKIYVWNYNGSKLTIKNIKLSTIGTQSII